MTVTWKHAVARWNRATAETRDNWREVARVARAELAPPRWARHGEWENTPSYVWDVPAATTHVRKSIDGTSYYLPLPASTGEAQG